MPIEVDSEIRILSEDEFHSMAEKVIGIVFGVHNDLGRLMDEDIYKQAIRRRCELTGIVPARREVQIKVRYHDFEKPYYMERSPTAISWSYKTILHPVGQHGQP